MNDDAKFFFCLSGFIGFMLLFLSTFIVHGDAILALVYGAIGCLCFSLFGRVLLGVALKGNIEKVSMPSPKGESESSDTSVHEERSPEEKKRLEALGAMSEAVTKAKPKVAVNA